ncbi:MAG TPA: glycoside hydrolase family 3 protein [Beijerinckia sp.]|jgi:beta-N-acetylhexosaminidase|nr:glycoside hydrolase family 3 protein [Beijerinckia sp.]
MPSTSIAEVGDHFLVGLRPTPVLHELDRALLADLRPAGVIFYKSNFRHDLPYEAWLESHAALIADIRQAIAREKFFLAIDHEGGRVCRSPAPITRFAYAAQWPDQAAEVGRAMGRELASLGFNLNFAPVLDIHTNPANPVIGARAFGTSADEVIAAALSFLQAMQAEGVLGCGKHFPGHGDTSVDSHYGLPSQSISLEDLRSRELKPFAAAIKAGIAMLMTSHIMFPAIDPAQPVTLSRRFATDILRDELRFTGVAISDDIGMGAMNGFFDAPDAAARFIAAGCDMLMVCAHWTESERARGFAQAILKALDEGSLDTGLAARSRARIAALLEHTPMNEVRALSPETFSAHASAGVLFQAATVEVI